MAENEGYLPTSDYGKKVANPSRRKFMSMFAVGAPAAIIAPGLIVNAITPQTNPGEGWEKPKSTPTARPETSPQVEVAAPPSAERIVQGIKEEGWRVFAIELPKKTYIITSTESESPLGNQQDMLVIQDRGYHEPAEFTRFMPADLVLQWEHVSEAVADQISSYVLLVVSGELTDADMKVLFFGSGSSNPSKFGLNDLLNPSYQVGGIPEEELVESLQYYVDALNDGTYNGIATANSQKD